MDSNLKLLLYIILGLLIFWIGSTFYFRFIKKERRQKGQTPINQDSGLETLNGTPDNDGASVPSTASSNDAKPPVNKKKEKDSSGGLMICPLCLFKMETGEMVKTTAFPPLTKFDKTRLMYIHGCIYCMGGKRERVCPVCGKPVSVNDYLIARLFDRPNRHSHVHVLGCPQCRPLKTM